MMISKWGFSLYVQEQKKVLPCQLLFAKKLSSEHHGGAA